MSIFYAVIIPTIVFATMLLTLFLLIRFVKRGGSNRPYWILFAIFAVLAVASVLLKGFWRL